MEHHSARRFAEQPQIVQNEHTTTTQDSQSTQSSASEGTPIIYPSLDDLLVPQVPRNWNPTGERARWSARGEPAILISPPFQDPTFPIYQHIVGLLGQITEHQDGIMRELRTMRREMRLMKGEQRRAHARVLSLVHGIEELKKHSEQQ